MYLFILAIVVVFVATGLCAIVEAALYAVRGTYIHRLAESGHPAGQILKSFKERMDNPITAILIFDTLLGVGGASIAGSQARALFGETFVYWFTLIMAISLLIFAQIIPKVVGVAYNESVSKYAAIPTSLGIKLLYPAVKVVELITRRLKPEAPPKQAEEEDVSQLAKISVEEGSILPVEESLIQNSLKLNDVCAKQIMTPIADAVTLSSESTVEDAFTKFRTHSFSRIPVFQGENPNEWKQLVFSRDILFAMANDKFNKTIGEIAHAIEFVSSDTPGHILLDSFLKRRVHLFAVFSDSNDQRSVVGLVTLEDVIEEILGKEIVDEKESSD